MIGWMRALIVAIAAGLLLAPTAVPEPAVASQEVSLTVAAYRYWSTGGNTHHVAGVVRNTSPYRVNGYAAMRLAPGNGSPDVSKSVQLFTWNLAPGATSGFEVAVGYYGPGTPHLIEISAGGYVVDTLPLGGVGVTRIGPVEPNGTDPPAVLVEVRNGMTWPLQLASVTATFFMANGSVGTAGQTLPAVLIDPGDSYMTWVYGLSEVDATSVDLSINGNPQDADPYTAVAWTNWFHDVGSSAFRAEIAWLREVGVTTGCGSFLFCPAASVTRAQMASFLARALDLPATATDYFSDDETSSAENDINRLAAAGITSGCAVGLYCPNGLVTREQMASFLARALELPPTATDYFTDDETSTHEANINRLAASGITSGCSATKYCPKTNVSREQMAAFLYRALH